jgi:hypothetical protein
MSKRYEKLQRSNMDFAEKAEEQAREFKQMLEQQTSEERARRAEEKRLYEEEIIKVRAEANRRVEEVGKIAEEIAQRVEEEARRRAEEKRLHEEEILRIREEANRRVEEEASRAEEKRLHEEEIIRVREDAHRRVEEVGKMAEETAQRVEEEARRRVEEKRLHEEEVRRLREEGDELVKQFTDIAQGINQKAENATKIVQEAVVVALARKKEAEQRCANFMEESEKKVRQAVEEMRVGHYPRTERHGFIRNPDLVIDDEDRIPIGGPSNRAIDDPSLAKIHHSRAMDRRVEPKVTSFQLPHFFSADLPMCNPCR